VVCSQIHYSISTATFLGSRCSEDYILLADFTPSQLARLLLILIPYVLRGAIKFQLKAIVFSIFIASAFSH
jgi:hypothetical protein